MPAFHRFIARPTPSCVPFDVRWSGGANTTPAMPTTNGSAMPPIRQIIVYTAVRFGQTAKEDDTLGHRRADRGSRGQGGIAAHRQISTKDLAD